MKRFALLSVAALMLASAVFAPAAVAQEYGDVEIQSVTLGTGGTADVTATIECGTGLRYQVLLEVRQTTGNRPYNVGKAEYPRQQVTSNTCQGTETFTVTVVGERPFTGGLLMSGRRSTCDSGERDLWSIGSVFMGPREPTSIDPSQHIPLQQTTATAILIRVDPVASSRRGRTNLRHLRA